MSVEQIREELEKEKREIEKLSELIEYTRLLLTEEKYCVSCAVLTFFLFVFRYLLPY